MFCGSNYGSNPAYRQAAQLMGETLAQQGIELVYGGGNVGLMGVVADAVLHAGGRAIGVLPKALEAKELAHTGLTELHIVHSMHERKALMADLSDGFVALPGGYGTFEEFCEVVTWTQLGFHQKPCGLLNVEGFYDPLIMMFDRATTEQFIRPIHRNLVLQAQEPEKLLKLLSDFEPVTTNKWAQEQDLER